MEINAASVGEYIKKIRTDAKLSQKDVADYLCSHGSKTQAKNISAYECGKANVTVPQFCLICECCGVDGIPGLRQHTKTFVQELNDAGRARLEEYISFLLNDNRYIKHPVTRAPKRRLPLYDMPVSAGTGIFLDSENYEMVEVSDTVPADANFALRISGDSMTPKFQNGQIIYVRQQQTIDEGDIGIFMLNNEAYCKQLSGNTLLSLNEEYAPIQLSEHDDLRVYGKVVG